MSEKDRSKLDLTCLPVHLLIIKNLYVQDVDNYVILYGTDNDANTQLMLLLMLLKKIILQRDEKIVISYVNIRLILVSLACSCQFL